MTTHAAELISSSIIVAAGSITFAIGSFNNRDEGMTMGFCVGVVGAGLFLKPGLLRVAHHLNVHESEAAPVGRER